MPSTLFPRHLRAVTVVTLMMAGCGQPPADPGSERVEATTARLGASEGARLILSSINAHGGLQAWYDAPTSSYNWEYSNTAANLRFKSYLVADNQSRLAYHDLMQVGTPDSVSEVTAQFAWNGTLAWMNPATVSGLNPMFWAMTGYYFQSIPFVLADPGLRYEMLPVDTLDGKPFDMVKVSFDEGVGQSDGDTYTIYVDQESRLVRAIRYTVTFGRGRPEPGAAPRESLFYYNDYTTVDGLTVASHFKGYQYDADGRGAPRSEAWATDISFRRPFDASRLEVPEGARTLLPKGSRKNNYLIWSRR